MTPDQAQAAGFRAFGQYRTCRHYAGYLPADEIKPADAMRFFLPPERQSSVQFHRPRSPEREAWIKGWINARSQWRQAEPVEEGI